MLLSLDYIFGLNIIWLQTSSRGLIILSRRPYHYSIPIKLSLVFILLTGASLHLNSFSCVSIPIDIELKCFEYTNPLFRFHGKVICFIVLNLLLYLIFWGVLGVLSNGLLWETFVSGHIVGLATILRETSIKIKHSMHMVNILDYSYLLLLF